MSGAHGGQHALDVRKVPLPDGISSTDVEGRRAWQQRLADSRVLHQGRLAHEAVLLRDDGTQVLVPLDDVIAEGDETHAAAILFQLLTRPGGVCVYRRGELHLMAMGAGAVPTRYACVLELYADEQGEVQTWAAMRQVGAGESGTGTLLDDWRTDARPVGEVVAVLQDWVDPGEVVAEISEGEEVSVPTPRIEMQIVLRDEGAQAPTTAAGFADEVGMLTDTTVVQEGLPDVRIFAFKDNCVEDWRVSGELPCSADDLVRNVAAWSQPDAIALLAAGVVTCPDGVTRRGAFTLVEYQGQRYERILPIYIAEDGGHSAPHALCRDREPVTGDAGWIGVAPGHDLGLHVQSQANAPGVVGEG